MSGTPRNTDGIRLTKQRELWLSAPSHPGGPAFISAASGLVVTRDRLYVVADDELSLGVFSRNRDKRGSLERLLPGELPLDPQPRKKAKPDFETLLRLPAFGPYSHGALFAIGSGSTPRRCRGALIPFDDTNELTHDVSIVELTEFFAALETEVGRVNIEGAALIGDRLLFLQRGNKGDGINAIATFSGRDFLASIERSRTVGALEPLAMQSYDLGSTRGVPFSFTDAAALVDGTIVFSAVAEDTKDAVADGACAGSAIGTIDREGALVRLCKVEEAAKIEGLHAIEHDNEIELLLVTDADDPTTPASLLSARMRR